MTFYTDEQLSMILTAADIICSNRWINSQDENDQEIVSTNRDFIDAVVGWDIKFERFDKLLTELRRYDLM